jgi:predicted transcriptional regulator of viral defense system
MEPGQRWQRLVELAASQAGHFTAQQAAALDISAQVLAYRVNSGAVVRCARGIFRLAHFPAGEHDSLVVLALWAGPEACFSHTTALWLHQLSDALPARAHVTVPTSFSSTKKVPDGVILHRRDVWSDGIAWLGPLRVTTPYDTLRDCLLDHVDPLLVRQAIEQGFARGMLTAQQAAALKRTAEKA